MTVAINHIELQKSYLDKYHDELAVLNSKMISLVEEMSDLKSQIEEKHKKIVAHNDYRKWLAEQLGVSEEDSDYFDKYEPEQIICRFKIKYEV